MSILCIGAAHLDHRGVLRGASMYGTSNRGDVHHDFGGVARNVAENLARLGVGVALFSRIGEDAAGDSVLRQLSTLGIDHSFVSRSATKPTASYTAILENTGELVIGLNDADIYDEVTWELLEPHLESMQRHAHWFVETNMPGAVIERLSACRRLYVDGVSVERVRRLKPVLDRIDVLFTNMAQAASLADRTLTDPEEAVRALSALGVRAGVVTNGAAGAVAWQGSETRAYDALPARPRDVTGAGDALVAGTLSGMVDGMPLLDAVRLGLAAAAITVESFHSTAPDLCKEFICRRLAI